MNKNICEIRLQGEKRVQLKLTSLTFFSMSKAAWTAVKALDQSSVIGLATS